MTKTVAIRKEDKNRWERRTPLSPLDLGTLGQKRGIRFLVEPSPTRVFPDDAYEAAGAVLQRDLSPADLVLAIKEVPDALIMAGKVYVCFAHVTKGQSGNMPTLARYMKLGCSLVDYERIVDEAGRRLIFFGRFAGQAGAIDSLHCLGQRLKVQGIDTPLAEVKKTHEYASLTEAKSHLADVGKRLEAGGLPDALRPLAIGVGGYGHVSAGAQEVLAALPMREVSPAELPVAAARKGAGRPAFVRTVFKEQDMVRPVDPSAPFELQDYFKNPERYASRFEDHLPHLDVLLQTIFWTPKYPRFVTREWVRREWKGGATPRLRVIGDISCDIDGSIEVTTHVTTPEAPCFVYDPEAGVSKDGFDGRGPVVMAVDNLPCELPREASEHFSSVLVSMVPDLLAADWAVDFDRLALPAPLKRAVVVHRGALTPDYQYLTRFLPV